MTSDPWRYRCSNPDCGSTQLVIRTTAGSRGKHFRGNLCDKRYYCNACNTASDKRKDMKTGELVA